ncbi:hypothetical protein NCC49_005129 [Naganishia albida]|nr:hypothetical protein NCC49_005129 [Naganishia albida]
MEARLKCQPTLADEPEPTVRTLETNQDFISNTAHTTWHPLVDATGDEENDAAESNAMVVGGEEIETGVVSRRERSMSAPVMSSRRSVLNPLFRAPKGNPALRHVRAAMARAKVSAQTRRKPKPGTEPGRVTKAARVTRTARVTRMGPARETAMAATTNRLRMSPAPLTLRTTVPHRPAAPANRPTKLPSWMRRDFPEPRVRTDGKRRGRAEGSKEVAPGRAQARLELRQGKRTISKLIEMLTPRGGERRTSAGWEREPSVSYDMETYR